MTIDLGPPPALPGPLRRVTSRVGRRGAYLVTFGLVYVLLGVEMGESIPVYAVAEQLMPLAWWRWAFLACGCIAVAAGSLLPPPKAIGFSALQIVAFAWGGSIVAAVFVAPGVGADDAVSGLLWLLLAVSTQIVSRLVEPSDMRALAAHSTAGDHPAGERRTPFRRRRRGR